MIEVPLQVVVCSQSTGMSDGEGEAFLDSAYRAFAGRAPGVTSSAIPSWMMGAALQPVECRRHSPPPTAPISEILGQALHTLVVAWVSEDTVQDADYVKWLGNVWTAVDQSNERHGMLIGLQDERLRKVFHEQADKLGVPNLKGCQISTWESSFAEAAGRPATNALRCLERARRLLCEGLNKGSQPLKLFISHAKIDGLSLARAMLHSIKQEPTLSEFYDAQDIIAGSNWEKELRKAVHSSALIALRTDVYDERPWCIQEIEWAEEAGTPIVVVDARSELYYPPSQNALEASPWVLVPDGSLTRILFCTLRENLQLLLMQRAVASLGPAVADGTVVLSRAPTWNSLAGALSKLQRQPAAAKHILYPDPPLSPMTRTSIKRLAQGVDPSVEVLNYTSFASKY